LSFGSTLHHCAEYFFRVKAPPPPSLDELLEFYERDWSSAGYESLEEEERYRNLGREILARFRESQCGSFRLPLAVEKMFIIDIDGVKLRGFIDRVDKTDNGGLAIIDYKSNQELFTNDYLGNDLQLTLYQLAAERMWQLPVESLTLYHLRSNTPCTCPPRTPDQLDEARQLVLKVADDIVNERFPATEHGYCPCDFPEHCPNHRHLYFPPSEQEILPGLAVTEAVEEYARLQAEIKEKQAELDEVRQKILDFCQDREITRVYGEEHCIDYRLTERSEFDEALARELLEPRGLWERVLHADQALLKGLLNDAGVPAEIKRCLESLRRVTGSYPQLRVKKREQE